MQFNLKPVEIRKAQTVLLISGILTLCSFVSSAGTKKLTDIGRYPFAPDEGYVESEQSLKQMIDMFADDIRRGFKMAGAGYLYEAFMEQVQTAYIEEKQLQQGAKMKWMLFRSQGNVKIRKKLEWAGDGSLSVFSFVVVKGNKHYEFIIPKACSNIALYNVIRVAPEEVIEPEEEEPVIVPEEEEAVLEEEVMEEEGEVEIEVPEPEPEAEKLEPEEEACVEIVIDDLGKTIVTVKEPEGMPEWEPGEWEDEEIIELVMRPWPASPYE